MMYCKMLTLWVIKKYTKVSQVKIHKRDLT